MTLPNLTPAAAAFADQIRHIETSIVADAAQVSTDRARAWKCCASQPTWPAIANMLNHPVLRLAILRASLAVSTGDPADEPAITFSRLHAGNPYRPDAGIAQE